VLQAIREDWDESRAMTEAYQAAEADLAEAREALAEAEEKLAACAAAGAEPVDDAESSDEGGGSDAAAFDAAVEANVAAGMGRGDAIRAAVRQHPEAHRAWQQARIRKDR
jgi:hypothetical protein